MEFFLVPSILLSFSSVNRYRRLDKVQMVEIKRVMLSVWATGKALWTGGSPFAGYTAMHPVNEEGKFVIQSRGIRLAFTNLNGGAPTNLWINDTNGNEVDILLGLTHAKDYVNYTGLLGGTIGQ